MVTDAYHECYSVCSVVTKYLRKFGIQIIGFDDGPINKLKNMSIGEAPTFVIMLDDRYRNQSHYMNKYGYRMNFGCFSIIFKDESNYPQEFTENYVNDYIKIDKYDENTIKKLFKKQNTLI